MQQHDLEGNLFNQYKFGGFTEFYAPNFKTFIDGRADLFIYNKVFYDYLKATGLDNSLEILDSYKIKYVLLQPNEPLVYLLMHTSGWRVIYSDHVAVLLERTTSTDSSASS
jgi:hypothetical protein